MVFTQKTSHTGQTFVILPAAQYRFSVRLGRDGHGTELVKREDFPTIAHTLLLENGISPVLTLYGDINDQE